MLHLSKVAVGCSSLERLSERNAARTAAGIASIRTRFRPKRAEELIGGSLYWIIRHRLVARQTIVGFGQDEQEGKVLIRLSPKLVPVRLVPMRAHQGWRYMAGSDAPPDLDGDEDALALLPAPLAEQLMSLALI